MVLVVVNLYSTFPEPKTTFTLLEGKLSEPSQPSVGGWEARLDASAPTAGWQCGTSGKCERADAGTIGLVHEHNSHTYKPFLATCTPAQASSPKPVPPPLSLTLPSFQPFQPCTLIVKKRSIADAHLRF